MSEEWVKSRQVSVVMATSWCDVASNRSQSSGEPVECFGRAIFCSILFDCAYQLGKQTVNEIRDTLIDSKQFGILFRAVG